MGATDADAVGKIEQDRSEQVGTADEGYAPLLSVADGGMILADGKRVDNGIGLQKGGIVRVEGDGYALLHQKRRDGRGRGVIALYSDGAKREALGDSTEGNASDTKEGQGAAFTNEQGAKIAFVKMGVACRHNFAGYSSRS